MTVDSNPKLERWTAIIEKDLFKMHSNSNYSVNVKNFYSREDPLIDYGVIDESIDIDYSIEDAKAEVKIRIGQSKFRKDVLYNFSYSCCVTGITEENLLVASHIIPWSINKHIRSDPRNGLCLYVEIDSFFDRGYISFDGNLEIIISKRKNYICPSLYTKLQTLEGKKIKLPSVWEINKDFLEFHRQNIFDAF